MNKRTTRSTPRPMVVESMLCPPPWSQPPEAPTDISLPGVEIDFL